MNWIQREKDKLRYISAKIGALQCNDDANSFPINIKVTKLLGAGTFGQVFAACEDELCEFGYAIKRIDVPLEDPEEKTVLLNSTYDLTLQKEIYEITNQNTSFVYVFATIECVFGKPIRLIKPRNEWTAGQLQTYNGWFEGLGVSHEDALLKVFPPLKSVYYIAMEKGEITLDEVRLPPHQQLSIFFQMYAAQSYLINLGYEHGDLEDRNVTLFRIDPDYSQDILFEGTQITVPYYGIRAAMIDLDSIVPVDPKYGPNPLKDLRSLTDVTNSKKMDKLLELANELFV